MPERRDRWFVLITITIVVIVTTLPYLFAARYAGDDYVFSGILLNPLDGNTYLAKMYQGWRGDLLFTLPYTAEDGQGSFLFVCYLFLGHLSRIAGAPLLHTFHTARVLATTFMLIAIYKYLGLFTSNRSTRRFTFILIVFGAGLGWMALPFGVITSDFWVAEAYPFLSAYVNPHFPLSLALLLCLLTIDVETLKGNKLRFVYKGLLVASGAFILAIVSPFGVALVLVILSSIIFREHYKTPSGIKSSPHFHKIVWIILGGVPLLFYYLWVTKNDPLLAAWNIQNQTASPPIWDLIIAFSPILIIALFNIIIILKNNYTKRNLLVSWVIMGIILLYLPWGLQRRFMMGLYIPLATLAALWIVENLSLRRGYPFILGLLIILIIPTNIIVLLAARHGILSHDPAIYLTSGEVQAFEWIKENTPSDALILSAPDTGLYIPAHTGRRVLYGHPYETVNAEQQEALVRRFFQGNLEPGDEEKLKDIDYLFEGPRERQLGGVPLEMRQYVAYQNQDVMVFQVVW